MTEKKNIRKSNREKHLHRPDGDAAKMPFELWRAPIFQPVSPQTMQKAQENTVTIKEQRIYARTITNEYGDKYMIYSSDLLRPTPDMNVLLGLIALFQYEIYGKEKFDKEKRNYDIALPMTALYKQLGFTSKHRDRLIDSLKRLSSLRLEIDRKNARAGQIKVGMTHPFGFEIKKKEKGEKSDRILLSMHRALFPQDHYLHRSSVLCAMLKSDTAKLIFWLMSSRSHLKVTTKELYDMLFPREPEETPPTAQSIWDWQTKKLKPATEELKAIGWFIKFDEKTKEWIFKIPMPVADEDEPEMLAENYDAESYVPQPA